MKLLNRFLPETSLTEKDMRNYESRQEKPPAVADNHVRRDRSDHERGRVGFHAVQGGPMQETAKGGRNIPR